MLALSDQPFTSELIPFAECAGGNYLCFVPVEVRAEVYFWDHELHVPDALTYIAKSFSEFEGLVRLDDTPAPTREEMGGGETWENPDPEVQKLLDQYRTPEGLARAKKRRGEEV